MPPPTSSQQEVSSILKKLRSALELKLKACSPSELPEKPSKIASQVFFNLAKETSELYSVVQKLRGNPLSQRDIEEHGTEFRRCVIIKEPKHASVLAIFILAGEDFLLETWSILLHHLGMWSDDEQPDKRLLQDGNLPIPVAQLHDVFSLEQAALFDKVQHRVCQLNPESLNLDFDKIRDDLWNGIDVEVVTKCECKNESGDVEQPEATDFWSPDAELVNFLHSHEDDVRALYIASEHIERQDRKEKLPADARLLREMYDRKQMEADIFIRSLDTKQRRQIFAVLIWIKTNPRSRTWRDFCEDNSGSELPEMPCSYQNLTFVKDVGGVQMKFFDAQFTFCPVELKRNKMVRFENLDAVRLPLIQKQWLGSGGSGAVYRVKVAEAYFDPNAPQEFAMKVLDRTKGFNYKEWYSADKLKHQLPEAHGIIMPLASVLTKSSVYLFMELADGDLYKFMAKVPGPTNFGERSQALLHMHNLAWSLQHLHLKIWVDEDGSGLKREAMIHGDIKAGNVLYKRLDEFGNLSNSPFKLSDFGVSTFHCSPKHGDGESARSWNSMPRLARSCPNFPPEAEDNREVNAKADIWGLGTVFPDYLAWMSGGPAAFEKFRTARRDGVKSEDKILYFTTDDSGDKILKPGIASWFNKLIGETDPGEQREMYQACWNLIRDLLLVCDPKKRGKIEEVTEGFSQILSKNQYEREGSKQQQSPNSGTAQHVPDSTSSRSSGRPTQGQPPQGEPTQGQPTQDELEPNASNDLRKKRNRAFQRAVKDMSQTSSEATAIKYAQPDDDIHMDVGYNDTAFHYAVYRKKVRLLMHLLEHHSDWLEQVNDHGQTALHSCVKPGGDRRVWVEMARLILDKRPSMAKLQDNNGCRAINLARSICNEGRDVQSMIELLVKYDHQ